MVIQIGFLVEGGWGVSDRFIGWGRGWSWMSWVAMWMWIEKQQKIESTSRFPSYYYMTYDNKKGKVTFSFIFCVRSLQIAPCSCDTMSVLMWRRKMEGQGASNNIEQHSRWSSNNQTCGTTSFILLWGSEVKIQMYVACSRGRREIWYFDWFCPKENVFLGNK